MTQFVDLCRTKNTQRRNLYSVGLRPPTKQRLQRRTQQQNVLENPHHPLLKQAPGCARKYFLLLSRLSQQKITLIVDPTRTTSYSSTLIDLCFTNTSSKIIKSGTIELSISDHVLVYMTHKVYYKQTGSKIVTIRNMKNFNRENNIRD